VTSAAASRSLERSGATLDGNGALFVSVGARDTIFFDATDDSIEF
jgi:hypothetical protein